MLSNFVKTTYCKASFAVCSILPTSYSVNLLCYVAFWLVLYKLVCNTERVYSTCTLYVKRNGGKWYGKELGKEQYVTERNRKRNILEQNGMS